MKSDHCKILLLEDDKSHIELIRRAFKEHHQYELIAVQTLLQARQAIRDSQPELIIADYRLPDGKGTDLIKSLQDPLQFSPLIILTSQGDERIAVDAMKYGAMDYIVKSPATFEDMPHIVERALREWQYRLDKIQADQALRESEEKYRHLIESLNEGIWVIDQNATTTFVNGHMAQLLGYEVAQMKESNVLNFLDSQSTLIFKENFEKCRKGMKSKYDLDFIRRDDTRVSTFMSLSPIFDKFGNYLGAIAGVQDVTARKQMEAAVRASDKKFRDLVENINDVLFTANKEGIIVYISPVVETMLGYTPIELIGHPFSEIVYQDDQDQIPMHDKDILSLDPNPVEFRIFSKLGEIIWTRSSSRPVIENGEVQGFQGVITDITISKRMESALLESQEKFRALTENSKDIIIRFTKDLRFFYVSPSIQSIVELTPDQLLGNKPEDLGFDEDFVRFLNNNIRHIFRTGRTVRKEFEFNSIYGKIILDWQLVPEYNPDGIVHTVLTSARDVTQQKSAERMIREREELFRQLFDQRDDAVMLVDLECQIININKAAKRLYGYRKSDFLKSGISIIMPEELSNKFSRAVNRIERKGSFSITRTIQKKKNDTEILVDIEAKLIKLQGRNLVYCILKDVTDQIRLEEEAKIYQAKLIQENKMASLGTLVSGVAHEVNNPTNFIMFNAPLLKEVWADAYPILHQYYEENGDFMLGGLPFAELESTMPELFSGISDGAERIKNIVENLKGFARQGEIDRHTKFNINEAVEIAVSMLRPEIRKHTNNFEFKCQPDLPKVWGSKQQIEQVIINLVMNSLQSLPDKGGMVKIETMYQDSSKTVRVDVADNGEGISDEGLERLMEPFYTTKHNIGGTGLGLSISYSILKEHNGSLEFQSHLGAGTLASIILPIGKQKQETHS